MTDLSGQFNQLLAGASLGLEIGAHAWPVPGVSPYYLDRVATYAGVEGTVDLLGDGRFLPVPSGALDYLCSSHVLEHLADPVSAVLEWARALRRGGLLYLVVPDKRHTFDEPRETTSPAHMIRDFLDGPSDEENLEHVREFVYDSDWARLAPGEPPGNREAHYRYQREQLASPDGADIHYHTFEPETLVALLRQAGITGGLRPVFRPLRIEQRHPPGRDDGIGLLLEKRTGPQRATIRGSGRFQKKGDSRPPLPLACPVTLRPLEARPQGFAVIGDPTVTYAYREGRPDLRPPPDSTPRRPWNHRWRRRLRLA